jgi:hypothetical protein
VRETRIVELKRGKQDVGLRGIPAEADLSSLALRARRVSIRLTEWSRERPAIDTMGGGASFEMDPSTGDLHWEPGSATRPVADGAPAGLVRCRVESPVAGKRPVQVTYLVKGFEWDAGYQVVLRGDLANDAEPVSVDLLGTVGIRNPTARAYENAALLLVARGEPENAVPPDELGFLMLDEGPLADPWLGDATAESTSYTYRVPGRADIAASAQTDVSLVRALRTPADRLYVMNAERFPLDVGAMKPLRKYVSFRYRAADIGYALPPGAARIFLGTRRAHLLQEGRLPRTAIDGEIRVDLGDEEAVRGMRRTTGLFPALEGFREEGFEVVVRNRRNSEVLIRIEEEPPLQLEWHVVQANEKHRVVDGRLRFEPRIEPVSEKRIFYRLRIRSAGL